MLRSRLLLSASVPALLALASCAQLPPPATTPPPPAPSRPARPAPGEPGVPVPAPPGPLTLAGEPLVTVGLTWDRDTLLIAPVVGLQTAPRPWPGARMLPAKSLLRIRAVGDVAVVESQRGAGWDQEFSAAARETCWLAGSDPAGITATWNGKRWRGVLGAFVNPRGSLTLVTRVPLETYMNGVVPGEIGALGEDRIEAGKAQAIAARSYTLFYMGRRAAEGFDLFATVEDQLYSPVESERPLATRCVTETRGQLALHSGQPIRSNYSSTCGGISADVWEAWPNPSMPYLVSHRDREGAADFCAASPHYRWKDTWTAAEFMANLRRHGPNFGIAFPPDGPGDLVDVRAESRSRSGRVWRLVVYTTTGRIVIPAYSIRMVVRRGGQPASILRSNLFKVAVRRDPATRKALAVVASGAGSGHGVGLCQTGALGMARAGKSAKSILEHYYPGSEIRALY